MIGPAQWRIGLGDYLAALSLSPDGRSFVAGSLAGDAVIVDAATGAVSAKLADHPLGVLAAAWSPDGTAVAVGGQDGVVRLYDPAGSAIGTNTCDGWIVELAWSPDGTWLGTAAGKSLMVMRADGDVVGRGEDVASTITDIAWSSNGRRVGVTSYGGVTWFEPTTFPSPAPVRHHRWKGSLLALELSPNGRWACAGAQDSSIHLWRLWSGGDLSMSGYPAKIDQLAFRHDSRWMASACLGEVTVWDFGGKGPSGTRPASAEAHDRHITTLRWVPGGVVLASGGADGSIVLWPSPARQGQRLKPLAVAVDDIGVSTMRWCPDASALVVGRADGGVERRPITPRA